MMAVEETVMHHALRRADAYAARLGIKVPILLAPMAGACPPSLAIAVAKAGGLGACGVLLMQPPEVAEWVAEFRKAGAGPFQLNAWCPDPPPVRNAAAEARVSEFLAGWGPRSRRDSPTSRRPISRLSVRPCSTPARRSFHR